MSLEKTSLIINELKEQSVKSPKLVAEELDSFLEEIAMNDGFGTERQYDPRGDGRNINCKSMFVSMNKSQTQHDRNLEVLNNLLNLLKDPYEDDLREYFIETFE